MSHHQNTYNPHYYLNARQEKYLEILHSCKLYPCLI